MEGPPLLGRRVRLRPVMPTDHDYLYQLATHPDITWRWRYRGQSIGYDTFLQQLWGGTLVHFVVERRDGGQRVGYVQAFDASERHGWCHFAVMLDPMLERSGWAIECLALFFNYVFTAWNFRKLYAVVLENNYEELHSGAGTWFITEGRLAEHEWFAGRYWDLVFLTVRREDWEPSGPALVAKLTERPAGPVRETA
ncbi:MAG TPA: GNAT family N-acetyltransferase [Acidimicrobiia bacterium]|nr:GNAT family N-acetyltransferase [Acidimicrobiia bacterium]